MKKTVFLSFSNDINALDPIGFLVLQKLLHSTYDLIILSKIKTTQVNLGKRKESDVTKSDVLVACGSNLKAQLATSATATLVVWIGMLSGSKSTPTFSFPQCFNLTVPFSCLNSDEEYCPSSNPGLCPWEKHKSLYYTWSLWVNSKIDWAL